MNEYRNKDEFNFRTGIDGNPKTLGFFVRNPSDGSYLCIPANNLINMKKSHKNIAQVDSFIENVPNLFLKECIKHILQF